MDDYLIRITDRLETLTPADRKAIADWLEEYRVLHSEVREPGAAYAVEQVPLFMTFEEYLEFEGKSDLRYEYVNGAAYAMTGVSVAHARIARELVLAVGNHLRGSPCEVFSVDLQLRIRNDTDEIVYYPDLMVDCQRERWGRDYVSNPKLVLEILSPTTRKIDLREKALTCRRMASVEEYVVVEQNEYKIIVYRREERWRPSTYVGPEAIAQFRSIGLSLPLTQVYEGTL